MEDLSITIKDEFIKLGQALKLAGLVSSGAVSYTHLTLPTNREV